MTPDVLPRLADVSDPPLPGFYPLITCQPDAVPEHEQTIIRAVMRDAWLRHRSWLFWFRLDPLGTLADSYAGRDEPVTRGATCTDEVFDRMIEKYLRSITGAKDKGG